MQTKHLHSVNECISTKASPLILRPTDYFLLGYLLKCSTEAKDCTCIQIICRHQHPPGDVIRSTANDGFRLHMFIVKSLPFFVGRKPIFVGLFGQFLHNATWLIFFTLVEHASSCWASLVSIFSTSFQPKTVKKVFCLT